jgi:hypothetical protein
MIDDSIMSTAKLIDAGVLTSVIGAITQHINNAELVKLCCTVLYRLLAENTTDINTELNQARVWELLPNIITAHINSSDILYSACMTVQYLATCDDTRVKLGHYGACEAVVDAAKANINNVGIARAGCNAIYNLTLYEDNKVKLGEAGACELLATILQEHSNNQMALLAVYKAMDQLALSNRANAAKLEYANVHVSVIKAITQHMGKVELARHGCLVLARLSYHSTTDMKTMINDGLCGVLPMVLLTYIGNSDVVLNAFIAVQKLANLNRHASAVKLGECGVCKAVVDAWKVYTNDEAIAAAGCKAVQQLVLNDSCRFQQGRYGERVGDGLQLIHAGVFEVLATTLQKYSNNTVMLLTALKATLELAKGSASESELVHAGLDTSLLNAITHHMDNVDVVKDGCEALSNVSYGYCSESVLSGLCEVLVRVLREQSDNMDMVHYACTKVQYLAQNDSVTDKLGDAGACELIVDALRANNSNEAITVAGCDAVQNLADNNKTNRKKLKAAGVVSVLDSVLKVHSGNQQNLQSARDALRAVSWLSVSSVKAAFR